MLGVSGASAVNVWTFTKFVCSKTVRYGSVELMQMTSPFETEMSSWD
jgi:hypothetical protein